MGSETINSAEKTREILQRVHQIELKTNRLVNDTLAGQYHSAFKGQGMNFDEVREYQAGDEVKNIDWNVTARTGRPFVKQFVEERELTIMLMIDVSASGTFGSSEQSKRDLAAELGSMFAFSAIRNRDKVGLILFSDHIEHYLPPRKGNNHVLRVIRDILFFQPKGRGTDIGAALDHANRMLHRNAVMVLISDFMVNPPYREKLDRLMRKMDITNRKHDLIAIAISDPVEREIPPCGYLALQDIETGEQVFLNTRDRKVLDHYARLNRERFEHLDTQLKKKRIDRLHITTGQPYLKEIYKFFKIRTQRRS
ncbi:MAG: DUF58 domain-containing protein [Puniceicoccaceae bacterium]